MCSYINSTHHKTKSMESLVMSEELEVEKCKMYCMAVENVFTTDYNLQTLCLSVCVCARVRIETLETPYVICERTLIAI